MCGAHKQRGAARKESQAGVRFPETLPDRPRFRQGPECDKAGLSSTRPPATAISVFPSSTFCGEGVDRMRVRGCFISIKLSVVFATSAALESICSLSFWARQSHPQ